VNGAAIQTVVRSVFVAPERRPSITRGGAQRNRGVLRTHNPKPASVGAFRKKSYEQIRRSHRTNRAALQSMVNDATAAGLCSRIAGGDRWPVRNRRSMT